MMDGSLMRYIPKPYKPLVVDIRREEKEYNEHTRKWAYPITVEWKNGEESTFQNAAFMRSCLKEFHGPDEFGG